MPEYKERLNVKSKIIVILLSVLFIYIGYSISRLWWGPTVPPEIDAYNTVLFCAEGIKIYFEKNRILPESLSEVYGKNGLSISTYDNWGNPILYHKNDDGLVTLISYGADGKAGGTKSGSDIIMSFYPKDADSFYKMYRWSSPPEYTKSKMVYLRQKIKEYYHTYKKLPRRLIDMQFDSNYFSNNDLDYWENPILYNTDRNTVLLTSYGLDGNKGGVGENEDIHLSFEVTTDESTIDDKSK